MAKWNKICKSLIGSGILLTPCLRFPCIKYGEGAGSRFTFGKIQWMLSYDSKPRFVTAALIPQPPGACWLTVHVLVPLENCLQLKATALPKDTSSSQEAAHIQWLSFQGCKGQALLPQFGKNTKCYPNSRAPYEIGWARCSTYRSPTSLSAQSCFLQSLADAVPESTCPPETSCMQISILESVFWEPNHPVVTWR